MNWVLLFYALGAVVMFCFLMSLVIKSGPPDELEDAGWAVLLALTFTVFWPVALAVHVINFYVEYRERKEWMNEHMGDDTTQD